MIILKSITQQIYDELRCFFVFFYSNLKLFSIYFIMTDELKECVLIIVVVIRRYSKQQYFIITPLHKCSLQCCPIFVFLTSE